MTRAQRWTGWRLAAPILGLIAATATAQQPGGLGGFFAASWGRNVAEEPAIPGLLHYWDPAGTLSSDDQADGLDGTTFGGLTETSADGWNMGTDDAKYVLLDGPITNGTNYTITAWIKPDMASIGGDNYTIISDTSKRFDASQIDFLFQITDRFSAQQRLTFRLFGPGGTETRDTVTNAIPDATWQHAAVVCDYGNDNLEVYWNGYSDGGVTFNASPNDSSTTEPGTIGGVGWNPAFSSVKYHGSIGKVRFYSRALSQSEIQSEIDADGGTGP